MLKKLKNKLINFKLRFIPMIKLDKNLFKINKKIIENLNFEIKKIIIKLSIFFSIYFFFLNY